MGGCSVIEHAPTRRFFALLHRRRSDSSSDDSLFNSSYHRSSATLSLRLVDITPARTPERTRSPSPSDSRRRSLSEVHEQTVYQHDRASEPRAARGAGRGDEPAGHVV